MKPGNRHKTPCSLISMDFIIRGGAIHIWAASVGEVRKDSALGEKVTLHFGGVGPAS